MNVSFLNARVKNNTSEQYPTLVYLLYLLTQVPVVLVSQQCQMSFWGVRGRDNESGLGGRTTLGRQTGDKYTEMLQQTFLLVNISEVQLL